jgi:hypothetical protein
MPLADRDERLAYMRERYRERLANEKGFREKEAARKAAFYARSPRYRKRVKAKVYAAREAAAA